MMKLNVVAILIVAGATGSLMSMDQKEVSRLNFYLGHNWRIKSYSATPLIKMKRDQQRNSFFVKITDSVMEFNLPEDTLFTQEVKK